MPQRVPAGNEWGDRWGYSRAVKSGNVIEVAGTVGAGDSVYEQACAAFQKILDALEQLGAGPGDVVRTRIFLVDPQRNGEEVGRAHAEFFGDVQPASAMLGITGLIDPQYLVEIEATAVV